MRHQLSDIRMLRFLSDAGARAIIQIHIVALHKLYLTSIAIMRELCESYKKAITSDQINVQIMESDMTADVRNACSDKVYPLEVAPL